MVRRPPRFTRTDTLFPYTTLFRSKRLTQAGYAIYAVDHWGHGASDGEGGYVPRFSAFLDGMAELLTLVEINHGDTPRLLLGHSMGGLIATLFLVERQQAFVAAALSRSDERRVGKECVSTCRSRGAPYT